ncbi:integrase core domain-containing protein [Pseudonocardia sp. McavD-2-B]|nr:integrase core domain-containing protein [Pseudonocardia sp. McavD-2-B]
MDNALVELSWSIMQRELLDTRDWGTPQQLSAAIFEWIEAWYNPRRLHTSTGYLAPADYERLHTTSATAA